MIKIAVFGVKGFPAFGGAARANENVINILKDKYQYTIYAVSTHANRNHQDNMYYQKIFKGVKGKRLNTLLYHVKSLCHALMFGDYDIVQVNHTSAGFIVPFLRLRFKVVSTARGIIPPNDNKWSRIDRLLFNWSAYLFFRFSNICISVSRPHIQLFRAFTHKEILYIPNGIFPREQKSFRRSEELIFAAGRIISLKGAHTLMEALNLISFTGKAKFIGDLDHTPKYKAYLQELGKKRNIEYIGLIKDKEELFGHIERCKVFVFPSFNEGMSNMLLEVASLKTPLICSDIPENRAVFSEKEVLFFDTGDPRDLAKKIEWAYANYEVMLEKAESAYKVLLECYLWESIAAGYSKIYDSLYVA